MYFRIFLCSMGFKKAAQNLSSPYVSAPLTASPFVIEREEGTLRLLFTVSPPPAGELHGTAAFGP